MGKLIKYTRETSAFEMFSKNNKVIQNLTTIALFVSFNAVCSQISIPLPFTPIPVNLALLSVFMSGTILGSVKGAVCQIVYIIGMCRRSGICQFPRGNRNYYWSNGRVHSRIYYSELHRRAV